MKDDRGFSLVELIIVIAILATLVAVVIPNLTKYVSQSKVQADESAKNEIEKAIIRACSQTGTNVTEPVLDTWVTFEDGSVFYDSSKIQCDEKGIQDFSGAVASEINKIPKSKVTGDYFKVKVTKNERGIYQVEIQ